MLRTQASSSSADEPPAMNGVSRGMQPVASCPWPCPAAMRCLPLQALHDLVGVAPRRPGSLLPDRINVGTRFAAVRRSPHPPGRAATPCRLRACAHERRAHVSLRELLLRDVLLDPARRVFAADDGEVHAGDRSAPRRRSRRANTARPAPAARAATALRGSAAATSTRFHRRSSAGERPALKRGVELSCW